MSEIIHVGLGKEEITPDVTDAIFLGFARPNQKSLNIKEKLHARSLIFKNSDTYWIYSNSEICFITNKLYQEVYKKLKEHDYFKDLKRDQLTLCAQHTHSSPGGYDEYAIYNIPNKGLIPKVLDRLTDGIVSSIIQAYRDLKPANLEYKEGFFQDEDVSFNRVLNAYIRNPEVSNKNINKKEAAPKKVQMLVITREGKKSFINWFPVHGTSIGSTNRDIHPDNKGMASKFSEEQENLELAVFSQECSGDISPNYIKENAKHRGFRGKFKNDFKSADFNGSLQSKKALEILNSNQGFKLGSFIDSDIMYLNFGKLSFNEDVKTTSGALGVSFLIGCPSDGRAFSDLLGFFLKYIVIFLNSFYLLKSYLFNKERYQRKKLYYKLQAPKVVVLATGKREFLSDSKSWLLKILKLADPLMGEFSNQYFKGALNENSWLQEILPVQFSTLGELLIVSLPFEPTTIAGLRIKKALEKEIQHTSISQIIINPYSNSYCGYVTTPEEYEAQTYEGGHTLYGKYTLPCIQNELVKIFRIYIKREEKRQLDKSTLPPTFSPSELSKRTNEFL